MSVLTDDQRAAIIARYGGLVRTYFSTSELSEARFSYRARLEASRVEFHDYLRLATVLASGRSLPAILHRITRAPSRRQRRRLFQSRGRLQGRIDVVSYLRNRNRLADVPVYPTWRTDTTYVTPENALAASAAASLVRELQVLSARLPIAGTSEGVLVRRIVSAIDELVREPALAEPLSARMPSVFGSGAEQLLSRVQLRWQTRRISNTAYADLWRWVTAFRRRGLSDDGLIRGLAYSEAFDDRLFEIYLLGCVRAALRSLGFEERVVRPLHQRQLPIFEFLHPLSGLSLNVHFQRGSGVVWTDPAAREWPDISGVPDVALVPVSTTHPVLLLDAKNRDRGVDLEESIGGELYKMLGYFHNFARTLRVGDRGPAAGLVFASNAGVGAVRTYSSQSGGLLCAVALDPTDDTAGSRVVDMVQELLRAIGLTGGRPPVAQELALAKRAGDVNEVDPEVTAEAVLERVHRITATHYAADVSAIQSASQSIELNLLGHSWASLDEEVHLLIATAEVFWAEHRLATGLDFAPVVVELGRAVETILHKGLFLPFAAWAEKQNLDSSPPTQSLGRMKAIIESASGAGTRRTGEAAALRTFLETHDLLEYAQSQLLDDLNYVNRLRRRAAHQDVMTGVEAGEMRERVLGVGRERPILAALIESLDSARDRGTELVRRQDT